MTTLVKFGETYNGSELALVKEKKNGMSWAQYPVTLTEGQLSTIKNQAEVVAVLSNSWKSPSAAAGIDTKKIAAPIIHTIDTQFRAAKLKYANYLAIAEGEDLKTLQALEQGYKIRSYTGFFGFFYTVMEFFGSKKYKSDIEVAKEGSNHRVAFMQQVSILESERLKEVQEKITKCITPLLADIGKKKVEDVALLRQLQQLTAIFHALFPTITHPEVEKAKTVLEGMSKDMEALLLKDGVAIIKPLALK